MSVMTLLIFQDQIQIELHQKNSIRARALDFVVFAAAVSQLGFVFLHRWPENFKASKICPDLLFFPCIPKKLDPELLKGRRIKVGF